MQAFGLEAVLTFTGFPDVFSERVASRHFPRALCLMLCCSVHGKNFIHMLSLCSPGTATVRSSDHSETQKRMMVRMEKTRLIIILTLSVLQTTWNKQVAFC